MNLLASRWQHRGRRKKTKMLGRLFLGAAPGLCVAVVLLASCGQTERASMPSAPSGAPASTEPQAAPQAPIDKPPAEISATKPAAGPPASSPAAAAQEAEAMRAEAREQSTAAERRRELEFRARYGRPDAPTVRRNGVTASRETELLARAAPPPPPQPVAAAPISQPDVFAAAGQITAKVDDASSASAPLPAAGPLPIWNAWMEKRQDAFKPATNLVPDASYVLRLHLAPFSYGKGEEGVATQGVSPSTNKAIEQWLERLPANQDTVTIDALLLFDSTYFKTPEQLWKPLTINVRRLKSTIKALSEAGAADPFAKLRSEREPAFVYGEVSFELRTKAAADLPKVSLSAAIAISLWDPDQNKPLDEISFGVCVQGTECGGVQPIHFGFSGLDTLRASLGDSASQPEVAVHLVQMAGGGMRGVLRERKSGEYQTWSLNTDLAGLQTSIDNVLAELATVNDERRTAIGEALLESIIPTGEEDGRKAKQAFIDAVMPYMQGAAYGRDELPAVFFRVAGRPYLEPSLWPLSLISVPVPVAGESRHLGRYFRVESPLAVQNFDSVDACIANWIVVGPTSTGATEAARARLDYIGMGIDSKPTLEVGSVPVPIIDDMSQFRTIVRGPEVPEAKPIELETKEGTLLTVLSHHHRDRIYFERGPGEVYAYQVRRRFTSPSVVLLQGCGTGQPGASGFIQQLNQRGFYAAVATLREIEAPMAGDYFNCFIKQFDEAPPEGLAIGILHTRAQRCLESAATPWGSKALLFSLLGNSGLKICRPRLPG